MGRLTIDSVALNQVVVSTTGEQSIAVSSDNALDVAMKCFMLMMLPSPSCSHGDDVPVVDIEKESLHLLRLTPVAVLRKMLKLNKSPVSS
jgi:hypothetical protein